eukprot:743799-Rhodomonas_salina.2
MYQTTSTPRTSLARLSTADGDWHCGLEGTPPVYEAVVPSVLFLFFCTVTGQRDVQVRLGPGCLLASTISRNSHGYQ